MADKLLVVTVTPTGAVPLDDAAVDRAVQGFGDALSEACVGDQQVLASVTFGWEPARPRPGSVLAALGAVLTDRGHDPAVIADRLALVDEDELWQHYLGPAADRLESLLGLNDIHVLDPLEWRAWGPFGSLAAANAFVEGDKYLSSCAVVHVGPFTPPPTYPPSAYHDAA